MKRVVNRSEEFAIWKMRRDRGMSVRYIAGRFGIHRSTVYRIIDRVTERIVKRVKSRSVLP